MNTQQASHLLSLIASDLKMQRMDGPQGITWMVPNLSIAIPHRHPEQWEMPVAYNAVIEGYKGVIYIGCTYLDTEAHGPVGFVRSILEVMDEHIGRFPYCAGLYKTMRLQLIDYYAKVKIHVNQNQPTQAASNQV